MGTLYVVPTPIGNLEDISYRAVRILREVTLIAAEDTRHSRILLDHYDIKTPLTSYHEHNSESKLPTIVGALSLGDVALISDAGTPTVSDPGYELVKDFAARGGKVVALPGPTAITTALSASGLPTNAFAFFGFLPRTPGKRHEFLSRLANRPETLVFYESARRIEASLEACLLALGDRRGVIACELTKYFEEYHRDSLRVLATAMRDRKLKGEITLLVEGFQEGPQEHWTEERVREALATARHKGLKPSQAAKLVAEMSGWSREATYAFSMAGRP